MPLTRAINLNRFNTGSNMGTTNLDPITYNDRYPGLDEFNYKKLETKINNLGLTGYEKEKAMDEAYGQVLPIVQTQIKNSDRQKFINQGKYEVSQMPDGKDKKTSSMKIEAVQLAQDIKEKYNIDPSMDDEYVLKTFVDRIPDGRQLLANYLNNGDKALLYEGGLEETPINALDNSRWKETWGKMRAESSVPLDAWEKLIYRTGKDLRNFDTKVTDFLAENFPKSLAEQYLGRDLTDEQYDWLVNKLKTENEKTRQQNKNDIVIYNDLVNDAYQRNKSKYTNKDVSDYYDNKGYTELLKEGDWNGFFYKSLGDGAQNWEMPLIIGATVVQPEVGRSLMALDSYARENQEAFDSLMQNGATYEEAEKGAVAVGVINAAVEVYMDKILGGVETHTADAIRKKLMKNVTEEASKKGLGKILLNQAWSSTEEGLEEIVQQIVQNAAVKTVNENQDLFEGIQQSFEGGLFNPLNLISGGTDVITNRNTIIQDVKNVANVGKNGKNLVTRTIPEYIAGKNAGLTIKQKNKVKATGTNVGGYLLEKQLAGLSEEDQIIGLENITRDLYNQKTELFKNKIPDTEKINNTKGISNLETFLAKKIENSDTYSLEYPELANKLKQMAGQENITPYEGLALQRDTDSLIKIFNQDGTIGQGDKKILGKWRRELNNQLIELGKQHGVDIRAINDDISAAVTIRDGLIDKISKDETKNPISWRDLGVGAILTSAHPMGTLAYMGASKVADNKSGKWAQSLYNMNEQPLERKSSLRKGAGFISNGNNNANGGLSLNSLIDSRDISSEGQELDVSNLDLGNVPLDTIPDRSVGVNPTDTVISENVNETAGNQAQELYNQEDNNLSSNSEQMTNDLNGILLNDLIGMKEGDQIHIEFSEEDGETITKVGDSYRTEYDSSDSDYSYQFIKQDELSKHLDNMEEAFGIEDYEYIDNVSKNKSSNVVMNYEGTEEDVEELRQTNPDEYNRLMDEEYELEQSRQKADISNMDIDEPRAYTAEELGLPPVSATMLKNLDRSKYIPVEDPKTKKVVFYKVEELEQIPITQNGKPVNFDRTYTSKELGLDQDDKTSTYFQAISNSNRSNIEKDINNLQIGQEIRYENQNGYGYGGRILKGKDGMVVEYDGVDGLDKVKQADIKEWIDNQKILGYIVIDNTNNNETYADEAYRPSITMTEKSISKKQAKENVNNLISDTWSEIGDEGDWDWYKKMKKKDVITYLEDQVLDEFSEARKRGYDYGLEWSEVQKLIKKFVNNKMK